MKSPSLKMKMMIDAFEENTVKKYGKEVFTRDAGDGKLVGKTDEKDDSKSMKNAFEKLMGSAQGGNLKINSPGRKLRKKIGSLKTPGKESTQRRIDDWIKKI